MNAPWWTIAIAGALGAIALWVNYILRRLKKYETTETLAKIKTDAKTHAGNNIDALIAETNLRRGRRKASEGK